MAYTQEQKDEALNVYATEGLAAAHDKTGISKRSITTWANAADPPITAPPQSSAKTEAARKVWEQQMEERKRDLASGLMDDIAQLRSRMFAPCVEKKIVTIAGSVKEQGTWAVAEAERDEPTFAEQKSLMTTIAIAVDKVQVLTGGATQRTEHRYESGVDAEIRDLTNALSVNDEPAKV